MDCLGPLNGELPPEDRAPESLGDLLPAAAPPRGYLTGERLLNVRCIESAMLGAFSLALRVPASDCFVPKLYWVELGDCLPLFLVAGSSES